LKNIKMQLGWNYRTLINLCWFKICLIFISALWKLVQQTHAKSFSLKSILLKSY